MLYSKLVLLNIQQHFLLQVIKTFMKPNIKLLFFLGWVIIIYSCKKTLPKPVEIPDPALFDLTISCNTINGVINQYSEFKYKVDNWSKLCVNPNNAKEFIYYNEYYSKLYSFNLLTMQSELIFDKKISGDPKWGKSGYILFIYQDSIFTLKSNGDSLIYREKGFSFCEWNYAGNKFMYLTSDINNKQLMIVQDFYSNKKDTLFNINAFGVWGNLNNLYLNTSDASFTITNMSTLLKLDFPYVLGNDLLPFQYKWLQTTEFVYTAHSKTIYKYNIDTRTNIKLIAFCENELPYSVTCSNLTNELIVLIKKYEVIPNSNKVLISTPKILIFNLNTNTISEVVLPM